MAIIGTDACCQRISVQEKLPLSICPSKNQEPDSQARRRLIHDENRRVYLEDEQVMRPVSHAERTVYHLYR